jgi:hypothetical protein
VGVGVLVGVAFAVAVGVGIGLAPLHAITRLYALTDPSPVAKSHPLAAPYDGLNEEFDVDSTPYEPDGL